MIGLSLPVAIWWTFTSVLEVPVMPLATQDVKPKKRVSLDVRQGTVREVAARLGEQTGCSVEVTDYLRERVISARFRGVTIEDALQALCELNDWIWQETESGRYSVSRKPIQLPKQPSDMERCFKAALPWDVRRYLGEGVLKEALKDFEAREKPAAGVLTLGIGSTPATPVFMARAENAVVKEAQTLHDTLRPNMAVGQRTDYSKLGMDERKRLLIHLLFRAVSNTEPGLVLAHEKLPPYVIDLRSATLELMGGRLMVMSHVREGIYMRGYGFGGSPIP